jgi:hypothetical protein
LHKLSYLIKNRVIFFRRAAFLVFYFKFHKICFFLRLALITFGNVFSTRLAMKKLPMRAVPTNSYIKAAHGAVLSTEILPEANTKVISVTCV